MGKIYQVSFRKQKKGKTIQELFDSIQLYRGEGRYLSEIFTAFADSGLWTKSRNTFYCEYYSYRASIKGASRKRKPSKKLQQERQVDDSPKDETDDSSEDQSTDSDQLPKKELTLEERRAIATELFKQKLGKE